MFNFSLKKLVINGIYYSILLFFILKTNSYKQIKFLDCLPIFIVAMLYYLSFTPLLTLFFDCKNQKIYPPNWLETLYSVLGLLIILITVLINFFTRPRVISFLPGLSFSVIAIPILSLFIYRCEKGRDDSIFDKNSLRSFYCFFLILSSYLLMTIVGLPLLWVLNLVLRAFLDSTVEIITLFAALLYSISLIYHFMGSFYGFIALIAILTRKRHSINLLPFLFHLPLLLCFLSVSSSLFPNRTILFFSLLLITLILLHQVYSFLRP